MVVLQKNTWIEIHQASFEKNIAVFRTLIGDDCRFMAVVKANAYGHGLREVAKLVNNLPVQWFGVFKVDEGLALRKSGIKRPILILGPVEPGRLPQAVAADLRITVSSIESAKNLATVCESPRRAHLKIETGTNRQGLIGEDLLEAARILKNGAVEIEGAYTHFADIEDTTEHAFARSQLTAFNDALAGLRANGFQIKIPHTACSAAALLFPDTHFEMVRVGISMYGLWPSKETLVSFIGANGKDAPALIPAMTWKTRIAQIKSVKTGQFIGYGRTYRTTRPSKIAVLPVGYADGYERRLSGAAHVLVRGVRAPVRGRICMNLMMVDVTDIPDVQDGDEVVLLGRQGDEVIKVEDLAGQAGTISYEIITRIASDLPRIVI